MLSGDRLDMEYEKKRHFTNDCQLSPLHSRMGMAGLAGSGVFGGGKSQGEL